MRAACAGWSPAPRVLGIELEPDQAERLDCPRDLEVTLGLEVVLEVEEQVHLGAGARAECRHLVSGRPEGGGGRRRAPGSRRAGEARRK